MVKLDLDVNEIVGLAEQGRIDEKKLKKYLKAATKEELEDYIIKSADFGNDSEEEDMPEPPEPPEEDDEDSEFD